MHYQKTITKEVSFEGRGLFSGEDVRLTFAPAEIDQGINFSVPEADPRRRVRPASGGLVSSGPAEEENIIRIPVSVKTVSLRYRRNAIEYKGITIET
ncbi:MAG: UDP-3-O-acyl-N-acetylglucosamine deacetylase, partial [Planctomycetota bacterium]|nr:UDP-3-O-acyl-N-acetylglucosamine deacetylase [Planctomycetota bacterium]